MQWFPFLVADFLALLAFKDRSKYIYVLFGRLQCVTEAHAC